MVSKILSALPRWCLLMPQKPSPPLVQARLAKASVLCSSLRGCRANAASPAPPRDSLVLYLIGHVFPGEEQGIQLSLSPMRPTPWAGLSHTLERI